MVTDGGRRVGSVQKSQPVPSGSSSFYEFVTLLIKRKVLVVTLLLLSLGGVAVANAIVSPVFRSEAQYALRIEKLLQSEGMQLPVGNLSTLALSDAVLDNVRNRMGVSLDNERLRSDVFRVSVDTDAGLVNINARGASAQEARGYVVAWQEAFATSLLERYHTGIRERLLMSENAMRSLQESAPQVELRTSDDPEEGGLMTDTLFALLAEREFGALLVTERLNHARFSHLIDRVNEIPSMEALVAPTLPPAPESPKKALNFVVGGLIGLLLGVGAALVRETWAVQKSYSARGASNAEGTSAL